MTPPAPERYRIDAALGAGGTGVVYRATDTQLERTVALKVLDETQLNDTARQRILREARAASALNHPSICTVYEVTAVAGHPCIVMEHVDGATLASAIPPEGLPQDLVVRYALEIADALAHAHERGVIHRDLKSANVMITRDGRAKVLDFGLARRVRDEQRGVATEVIADADAEGAIGGTLPYISPAVLEGETPRAEDDLWSLGVLLYELATGELPFRGSSRYQLATSIQRDAPAPMPPWVSAGLRGVILRCLARDPGARYRRAHEVRAALEALNSDAGAVTTSRAARSSSRVAAVAALVVLVTVLTAAFVWSRRDLSASGSRKAIAAADPVSVAVLPFTNPDSDPQLEYLTHGIAESVIGSLARVPGKLTVTAWSAVQRYRGRQIDAKTVGQELGAAAILLGSITRRDGIVSVDLELVDANDRSRLWGDIYGVSPADLQHIATRISAAMQLRLSGEEQRALRRHYPASPEALDFYLKGQYHWYRFTPEDYRRSLGYFHAAIERDPGYALAHAAVARVLSSMTYEGFSPPSTYIQVERAASTALSIDRTLGAAHDALAQLKFAYQWDWAGSEQEFQRALALSPRDEAIHMYYGIFLRTQRRWDEAIAQMQRALSLNPISVEATKALASTYFWARDYDKAIDQFNRALALDPTHSRTLDLLADTYAAKGLYAKALETRRRYLETEGAFDAAEALGHDGSEAGYRKAMRGLYWRYLARLEEDAKNPTAYISPMEFAFVYIAIGDADRAFAALEKAFSERAPWLSSLAADPAFDPVRADPRFASLAARVGVPAARP